MKTAKNKFENATVEATIIRADGTRVNLGTIARLKKQNRFISFIKKIFGR